MLENTDENKENLEGVQENTPIANEESTTNAEAEVKSVEEVKEPEASEEKAAEPTDDATPKVEEVAEDKKEEPVKEEVVVDYSGFDLESLVKELEKLLKNEPVQSIKNSVDAIKNNFNQKFGALLNEKKQAFLDGGGNEIDFQYHFPLKSQYNDLLFEYKTKRDRYYKAQQDSQQENLEKRLALIEEIKELVEKGNPSTMYKDFKSLQDTWKTIGKIPHDKYNDVWRTYHHHVERFYDLLHLSNDFRDLDFKHNLEEKLKLIERAEALVNEPEANKAFKELQVLHRLWKEDIGPVAREHREDVWQKFSDATKKIHDRRHEAQKELESKFEENLEKKIVVIEAIKNLGKDTSNSHSEWQKKIKELENLRQQFFKLGRVPRAKSNETWQAFKEATRDFNKEKNAFYKGVKKVQQDNLSKKMDLVNQAESLKDSEDWEMVTPIMKQIQLDWKKIGHVPKKYSDDIWKKFKDACNHYFDRLHGKQDEANKEQLEIFNKKKELLENLKSQAHSNDTLSLEVIQSYTEDWKKLGAVPHNMRHIEGKFNKVLDKLYEKLDMDKGDVAMLKFKSFVDGYLANNDVRKLNDEQYFIRKKIDETTREIKQLENNISFISNAGEDNPLVKGVLKNIATYQEDLKVWKTKLSYLTNLDY